MAVAKTGGGAGAAGGTTIAATRIEVIDPHVVQMMRDVMDSSEIPLRLNVAAAAGGGGGGGGLDNVGSTATVGTAATQPGTISRCVVTTAAGDGGAGGAGTANSIHSIFAGGYLPGVNNTIDRVLIQTTGNAADFGDLFFRTHENSGSSDSHGGLS